MSDVDGTNARVVVEDGPPQALRDITHVRITAIVQSDDRVTYDAPRQDSAESRPKLTRPAVSSPKDTRRFTVRTGGLISDWLGEVRIAEPELFDDDLFGHSRLIAWKSGRFELGYPFGMPLGVHPGISVQVYTAGAFCCATTETQVMVPVTDDELDWFELIAVATHLMNVDQSNVLETSLGRRVKLTWPASGSSDVDSYRVYYDNHTGTVDYGTVIDEVDAKPGGLPLESYIWTSGALQGGVWKFGVRAVDAAGNVSTTPAREVQVTITPVPDPPMDIAHTYDDPSHKATLTWSAPENWD